MKNDYTGKDDLSDEIEVLSLDDDDRNNFNFNKLSSEDRQIKSESKLRKILLLIFVIGAFLMVFYAVFAQPISHDLKQTSNNLLDIGFVDMYQKSIYGDARELGKSTFSRKKANFYVSLTNPGDEITYSLIIENSSKINAKVSKITIDPINKDDDLILYYVDGINVGDELGSGKKIEMTVTAKYNKLVSGQISSKSVNVIIDYEQK